jgi:hypothetical protein
MTWTDCLTVYKAATSRSKDTGFVNFVSAGSRLQITYEDIFGVVSEESISYLTLLLDHGGVPVIPASYS